MQATMEDLQRQGSRSFGYIATEVVPWARIGSLKPWELEKIQAWIFKNHLAIRDTWIMYNKNRRYMGK